MQNQLVCGKPFLFMVVCGIFSMNPLTYPIGFVLAGMVLHTDQHNISFYQLVLLLNTDQPNGMGHQRMVENLIQTQHQHHLPRDCREYFLLSIGPLH